MNLVEENDYEINVETIDMAMVDTLAHIKNGHGMASSLGSLIFLTTISDYGVMINAEDMYGLIFCNKENIKKGLISEEPEGLRVHWDFHIKDISTIGEELVRFTVEGDDGTEAALDFDIQAKETIDGVMEALKGELQ